MSRETVFYTAESLRMALRHTMGKKLDRLEHLGILKIYDTDDAMNSDPNGSNDDTLCLVATTVSGDQEYVDRIVAPLLEDCIEFDNGERASRIQAAVGYKQ